MLALGNASGSNSGIPSCFLSLCASSACSSSLLHRSTASPGATRWNGEAPGQETDSWSQTDWLTLGSKCVLVFDGSSIGFALRPRVNSIVSPKKRYRQPTFLSSITNQHVRIHGHTLDPFFTEGGTLRDIDWRSLPRIGKALEGVGRKYQSLNP